MAALDEKANAMDLFETQSEATMAESRPLAERMRPAIVLPSIIPIKRPEFTLKMPDGLSYYMTKLGIAEEFEYRSEWSEIWELE